MAVNPTDTRAAEFREALAQHPLVADGAMGSMLLSRGLAPNRCLEELNLSLAAMVRDVHRAYLEAGAQIIGTNTFGANRTRLDTYGLGAKVQLINRIGVRIAREAARGAVQDPTSPANVASAGKSGAEGSVGEAAFVAGVMGPTGARLAPLGTMTQDRAMAIFEEQAAALHAEGVDLFLLETFRDLVELEAAVNAVRTVAGPDLPIAAQVSLEEDGRLQDGTPVETIARRLDQMAIDIIGVNCSSGPKSTLEAIEKFTAATEKPLMASPSAGIPSIDGNRAGYPVTPEYFADFADLLLDAGASIVGGCCGTTPEHIHQLADVVDEIEPADLPARPAVKPVKPAEVASTAPSPMEKKSELGRKLSTGQFVTVVELSLPRSHSASGQVAAAKACAAASIDAVSFAAGYRARARLSTSATCLVVQAKAKIETVLYVPCRGKSITAIESELLGAQSVGLDNLLCLTGDGPGGLEVDSIGLLRIASHLNRGEDFGGNPNPPATTLLLGVAANPYAANLDRELERLNAKIEAGAEYIITKPIFESERLEQFLKRVRSLGVAAEKIPVIASIRPLFGLRDAQYLAGELGFPVPEVMLDRLEQAGGEKAAAEEGIRIAKEIAASIGRLVAGVRVVAAESATPEKATEKSEKAMTAAIQIAQAAREAAQTTEVR